MISDEDRLRIACEIVRNQSKKAEVTETEHVIPVHGITLRKLLKLTKKVSRIYRKRKENGDKPDFEEILEDIIVHDFHSDDAQHIVKHVLGHFFTWRRHKALSEEANKIALERGIILL